MEDHNDTAPRIRVMTFNIDGGGRPTTINQQWESRHSLCTGIICAQQADIIGLQEVYEHNRHHLESSLSAYTCEYGHRTCQESAALTMYNPIFWRRDRFSKIAAGAFFLSEEPDRRSVGWDAMYVRSATWVKLRCRYSTETIIHLNAHLDHRGQQARIESSKLIVKTLRELQEAQDAVIVTGDFNSRAWIPPNEKRVTYPPPILPQYLPTSYEVIACFLQDEFRDTYLDAGFRNQLDMNTYHDYYGDGFPPVALRIDWILCDNRLKTASHQTVFDALPPIYASDHYPVVADLYLSE